MILMSIDLLLVKKKEKSMILVSNVANRGDYARNGIGSTQGSLCLPLNFLVNTKLL